MALRTKPDECGCHPGCTVLPHDCEKPCEWPSCLTPEEEAELAADIMNDPDLNP
jgi:hypothetical protein